MPHFISKLLSTSILILIFCCAPSPARAASDLVITSITRVSDCTTLHWVSHTGEWYRVFWTDNLCPPIFWRVAQANVPSGGTNTIWREGCCASEEMMMMSSLVSPGSSVQLSEKEWEEKVAAGQERAEEGIKFLTEKLAEATGKNSKSSGESSLLSVPSPPGGGTNTNSVAGITTARFYRVARVDAGFIDGWGFGVGDIPEGFTNVIALSAGLRDAGTHNLALLTDGTVLAWGANSFGQTNVPAGLSNVIAIAAGGRHSVALKRGGSITNWGDTSLGQITNAPANLTNVVDVKAGLWHTLVLRADGTVAAWGDLFNRTNAVPAGLSGVTAISAGPRHCLALKCDGTVVAWGFTFTNLLDNFLPTNVPASLSNVIAISAGMEHNQALLADGTVCVWGHTNNPALGNQPLFTNIIALSAGWHFGTALTNGDRATLLNWGQIENDATRDAIVAVSAGASHVLVIRTNNESPVIHRHPRSLFEPPGTSTNISVVAASALTLSYQWQRSNSVWADLSGATSNVLLFPNMQATNDGHYRVMVSTAAKTNISRAALVETLQAPIISSQSPELALRRVQGASETLSVLITNHGARALTYNWFKNGSPAPFSMGPMYGLSFASTNVEGSYQLIVSNRAGRATSAVWQVSVTIPGEATMWGDTSFGQLNGRSRNETNLVAIAAGNYHTLGLRENGTIIAWGTNSSGQTDVPAGLSNVIALAGGAAHSMVLLENGTVRAWGHNQHGQTNVPSSATNVTAIAAGGPQSVALRRDGTLVAWGNTYIPAGVSNIAAIAAGATHALALLSNSTVQAWGLTPPSGLSNIVAVACGHDHALALKKDGTVVGWGDNSYGATNVLAGLSNVMRITAGYQFNLAMKNDGTVVAWGHNNHGQTNVPVGLSNICAIAAGTYHSVALAYNERLEYPVTAQEDLLLIYNTNSADSIWVKDYYLAHRPMAGQANVMAINYAAAETISRPLFTNVFRVPVLNWLAENPTKRPKYWVLFLDVPSRMNNYYTNNGSYNSCYLLTNGLGYCDPVENSTSYELSLLPEARNPLIMHINMDGTNACRAYIDKLERFGTNYSPGKLVISAHAGGYGNTNYYFDGASNDGHADSIALAGRLTVLLAGASSNSVIYSDIRPDTGLSSHITTGTNVSGYVCWGFHSSLGGTYAISNTVTFSGESDWFIVATGESLNGLRVFIGEGRFVDWFSENAFGQANFASTAVGGVSQTDEPFQGGLADTAVLFHHWHLGRRFGHLAWRARQTPYFQAIGDPLITR